MTREAELAAALDGLAWVKAQIADAMRRDGDHRHEIVQLRRRLAQQIGEIGTLGERVFTTSEDRAAFQSRFSAMRAATATHQANWPAVTLGERRQEFMASIEPVRLASEAFANWVRDAMRRGR